MADRRSVRFDAELEIRDVDATAISATTSETAIAIPITKNLAHKCVIIAKAYSSYVATTAQWTITVEASADNSTFKQVGNAITPVGTADQFFIALEGAAIADVVPDAAYIRTTATKTGTPGTLQYGAFLAPEM
jgi:hypothetical protein